MEIPPPLPYAQRLAKVQRIVKGATFRNDIKLAVKELCEAMTELSGALMDRELGSGAQAPNAGSEPKPPT
jgi:hypothetical protein